MEYTEYKNIKDNIRVREVTYDCPDWGDEITDYCFEVFKRPYFWGLIGKKKWEDVIQTNSFSMGLSFSESLINR